MDEVLTGRPVSQGEPPAPLDMEAVLARLRASNKDFSFAMDRAPGFALGDEVVTRNTPVPGHTRLPAYARGHKGRIIAHHGGHLYADAGARGEHVGEHLYTVEFTALELWGTDDPDSVCLDLWEPYLARP